MYSITFDQTHEPPPAKTVRNPLNPPQIRASSVDLRVDEKLPQKTAGGVHQRRECATQSVRYLLGYAVDVIDAIIPPRDWVDHMDKLHIQYVSHQPASREDVIELRDRLNKMLEDRQARAQGVCPIR